MNKLRLLEERFGGWWTGITFHHETPPNGNLATRPMRLCEAINESRKGALLLTRELLDCPGGSRSLGWGPGDDAIAHAMAEKMDINIGIARRAINNTPCLSEGTVAVTVGSYDSPDVVVSYAQPEAAMKLLRQWQRIHGTNLRVEVSSFMSVCGSVVVKAYLTGQACLSFGCPDAREHGAIGRDRLVLGMPFRLIEELFE